MPDNDDKFTDISKIMYCTEEEIKADAVIKIFEENIKKLKTSFEKTYQDKLEEKTNEIKKDLTEKFDEEVKNLKNDFKNELKDLRGGTDRKWWVIGIAIISFLAFCLGYFVDIYIKSIDLKFQTYQTFCEKIVDEKIQNKILIKHIKHK